MLLRPIRALVLALVVAASTSLVSQPPSLAQESTVEIPPLPRPRPDRTAGDSVPPATADTPGTSSATEAISALTSAPQPVTLSAHITEGSSAIADGLTWRVFEAEPDASGEMALVAKSEQGAPQLDLPPGEYLVHVAYGRAQVSEKITVAPGNNQASLVLDAGALRLNSAVTGDIPISPALLKFDIFAVADGGERAMVVEGLPPNDIVTLNAGTYQIVSHFGTVNASVRADLRVEPGQLTDATLYQHASEVSFKLVSEEGGSAIADVEWTVKSSDGTTVFSNSGAFPATVLAEGEYLVLAKQGDQVFNREIQIEPSSPREIEVLTSAF